MEQFKSWTLRKCDFSIADQRLTVHVREFYRTLLGQTPILPFWGLTPISVSMLDLLEVPERLVEVPEERRQNFRSGRLRARNTILEQAGYAVASREQRVLLPQPGEYPAFDLLHRDVAEARAARAADGVPLRDERPPAEELRRLDCEMKRV